jgi:hypothetical protein
MSSEWVASTATAIVGLAGIAATWLTARSSRHDQQTMLERQHQETREAELREARRSSFTALSGTITNVIWSAEFPTQEVDQIDELRRELSRSLAEVQILGGEAVRQLAGRASAASLRFLANSMEGCERDRKDELSLQARSYLNLLQRIMAGDLGIPPGSSVEEIVRFGKVVRYIDRVHKSSRHGMGNEKVTEPGHVSSGGAEHESDTSP